MKEIERQIYEKPRSLYDKHGAKSNKFLGSMTIEVINPYLMPSFLRAPMGTFNRYVEELREPQRKSF